MKNSHVSFRKNHTDWETFWTFDKYRYLQGYNLKPKTPIKNLFLTGQDITTVGLPSALASGVLTSSTILRKNLFKTI